MGSNRLRVYYGPEEERASASGARTAVAPETVTLAVGDIIPWLADAALRKRRWLRDFDDDEIVISRDLYEVIMAYRQYHRPSA